MLNLILFSRKDQEAELSEYIRLTFHLLHVTREKTALRVESLQQISPKICIRGSVLLHDNLPFAQRPFTHLEETFSCKDFLDLLLVVSLYFMLH